MIPKKCPTCGARIRAVEVTERFFVLRKIYASPWASKMAYRFVQEGDEQVTALRFECSKAPHPLTEDQERDLLTEAWEVS